MEGRNEGVRETMATNIFSLHFCTTRDTIMATGDKITCMFKHNHDTSPHILHRLRSHRGSITRDQFVEELFWNIRNRITRFSLVLLLISPVFARNVNQNGTHIVGYLGNLKRDQKNEKRLRLPRVTFRRRRDSGHAANKS